MLTCTYGQTVKCAHGQMNTCAHGQNNNAHDATLLEIMEIYSIFMISSFCCFNE